MVSTSDWVPIKCHNPARHHWNRRKLLFNQVVLRVKLPALLRPEEMTRQYTWDMQIPPTMNPLPKTLASQSPLKMIIQYNTIGLAKSDPFEDTAAVDFGVDEPFEDDAASTFGADFKSGSALVIITEDDYAG